MEQTILTEAIASKGGKTPIQSIEKLNLWGLGLVDISLIKQMTSLKAAALSSNNIESLEPFSYCHNLEELYLRRNKISDLDELKHLVHLPNLSVIWLTDNPIASLDNYRLRTIALLPQLRKLDETDISPEEREAAKAFSHRSLPASTPTATQVQKRVLQAIACLLPELNSESLDLLAAHIQKMIRTSK